jgi:hypothetical protein
MRPVLLLEINEVPIRVWEHFAEDPRFPGIARLLRESHRIETLQTDPGELSPWCTWPTIHRGLSKAEHGIYNLGQDPATFRGVPLWEEFRQRGLATGVFGSLQSWPPRDPGPGGFHVPDTFAPDERCFPAYLEPIQAFNLSQVRNNARVMSNRAVVRPPSVKLLAALLRSGVTPGTLMKIAAQLCREKFSSAARERRVSFQALLFWDIFRAHFHPARPPALATFFTNHVASVMHRYWSHVFPGDFPESHRPAVTEHSGTMQFAMQIADQMLREALAWRSQNPEILLLVANSMGQAAIVRTGHEGFELLLREPTKLLAVLSLSLEVRQNLAMMPQVSLEFSTIERAVEAAGALARVTTVCGTQLIRCDQKGVSLSVSVITPKASQLSGDKILAGGKQIGLSECGFMKEQVEAGTAYHVPEGILFAHGLSDGDSKPVRIEARDAKALILKWAGV